MNMHTVSFRTAEPEWSALRQLLFSDKENETAAALLCGRASMENEDVLLFKTAVPVMDGEYTAREPFHLEVSPGFYNRVIDAAIRERLCVMVVHSHPHSIDAWYSKSDDFGESRLLPVLKSLLPQSITGSIVVAQQSASGRWLEDARIIPLRTLQFRGFRSKTIDLTGGNKEVKPVDSRFDRQVRAFGDEGQAVVERIRVGIVGVGGTGSIVAELLARVGIRDFVIVDPDRLEHSNIIRTLGTRRADVGKLKVDVAKDGLSRLGVERVEIFSDSAIYQHILAKLRDRDIVFSCVDNHLSRALLNRFSHQYLVPVIDMGIRIDARGGEVRAVGGRVTVVGHGMCCLRCSQHINSEVIRAESLSKEDRNRLGSQGYVVGVDEPAPAVVPLNGIVASMAVTAGLNLYVGMTGGPQPVDQIYDGREGVVFTTQARHDKDCDVCDLWKGVVALGDRQIVSAYE